MRRWLGACVFCLLDPFPFCERRRWAHCIPTFISACVSHTRHAWIEQILYLEASKKEIQITDQFLDGIFLGITKGSEEFIVGTPAGCVVCRTVKRHPREDAADLVSFTSTRRTPRLRAAKDTTVANGCASWA